MATDRTISRASLIRWLFPFVLAALALLALERTFGPGAPNVPRAPAPPPIFVGGPKSYEEALSRIDASLAGARQRAEERSGEWLMHAVLARRYLARARLTGSFDDYAAADAALARAFAVARPGTGPHATQAMLDFTLHRLAGAERALDSMDAYAVPPGRIERAEMIAMRGDIAFYRGRYAEALAAYAEADVIAPGSADFRRAVYHSMTGRPDLADRYFERAAAGTPFRTPQAAAYIELQRGILDLDRGHWDAALIRFRAADRLFPGHWLIEEHIAEVLALKGDIETAERLYRDIVGSTGHPEFMDALAGLARGQGDTAGARRWSHRAAGEWTRRLRLLPEAAYGHAIDHCLATEKWDCALDLARRNHANRSYGEAKVLLAEALFRSGRLAEAREAIDQVLASPWRTARTRAVAIRIEEAPLP
ncbi:tetratricopeptide repeat protein [Allosphingosinicella sp.]|uniref:tetratricopeptide repeat protein n=1 Tax=Allosphingosinicella sp. TaxID=2823234 RepID=UPI003D70FC67